ncbi:MAG: efflux RND transporter permease subunit [Bacteroidales bacterium]|nr:MAG: efflux RND transporter permease subunit [Bacteroidales bacterium]
MKDKAETTSKNMNIEKKIDSIIRDFKITTLALKNRSTVFLLTVVIAIFGILSYNQLPKELFPELVIPTILIQTPYPGNSPLDIENLVTRPIEKEVETINGIRELSSNSIQDASMVIVEFNTNVNFEDALQDVKDAVDKAKSELPNDLLTDPIVMDIDVSEFPIININLSGDFSIEELKSYAEYLEDQIETISEISKVNIKGIDDKEIRINVDLHRLEAYELTFFDIESAITAENISISGGEIKLGTTRRSIRTVGEFDNTDEIKDIIINHDNGNIVYLKDVAEVIDGYAEPTNFARLDKEPVVSLQVVKKSGENLLSATDQIIAIMVEAQQSGAVPATMTVSYSNDQSEMIRIQLNNLENSMIMAVILVILVLFYFLGTRNALFVGLAIPMSMFTSFMVLNLIGYKINMIVLFSLILALGMLVDNAIVVVENIYRFVDRGFKPLEAARQAVGEIAVPIIASTITTLAAFLPLAFWGGITGEFMKYLPITLIIVLSSSLFVALVIIPVFAGTLIKSGVNRRDNTPNRKRSFIIVGIMFFLAVIFYIARTYYAANLLAIFGLIILLNSLYFYKAERWFREVFLVFLENFYLKILLFALKGKNPVKFFIGTVLLLLSTIVLFMIRQPNVNFFPESDPNYINVVAELPIGTDISATDSVMRLLETDIDIILGERKNIVETILTTVGTGSSDGFSTGDEPNKGLITVSFIDFQDRGEINTNHIMQDLSRDLINKYPGVRLSFEKDDMGPPTGRDVNIEISGRDFEILIALTDSVETFINKANIQGIEGLRKDLDVGKPELIVHIDRDKARRFGLSTMQIATTLRTALFGREISDFKVGEEEYPIQLRLNDEYRYSVASLMNQRISFWEEGNLIQLPISAIADLKYSTTYGAVNRKDMKRVITLYSNVLPGYNGTRINQQLETLLAEYNLPDGYQIEFTGEQEEQTESMQFLVRSLLIAVALILIILVTQFNSLIRPLIIIASVVFSTIGVFGGISTFKMDFIVAMTGIGIVSLAGIVVNNAIVLIDYIELLKARKRKELGIGENEFLPVEYATECVVTAGKTRLRPVLLTAITTVLGLLPLAVGMNINFNTMLSNFDPQLYFGGDMMAFWGPVSWTVIFGLTFATFLTLVIVPVMYRITILIQKRARVLFRLRRIQSNRSGG